MSQTQTTHDTNPATLETSAKSKKKVTTDKVKEEGLDLDDLMNGEIPDTETLLFNAQEMMDFEAKVDWLIRNQRAKPGFDPKKADPIFMEVDDKFLIQLNNGTLPKSNYVIWKNVRVCKKGSAELIAREEGKTIHEVVFKNEDKYRLVTVLKK